MMPAPMTKNKDTIKNIDRLKRRSDFLRVQAAGKKWVSSSIIVQAAPNDEQGRRYGLTVTKKLFKRAVDRNRIKRRMRAAACEILPGLLLNHQDVVLIGRVAAKDRPYQDLCEDLRWCLKRLEVTI